MREPKTCSVRQAARLAGVTVQTVRRWIRDGRIKAKRPLRQGSSRYRVSIASLQKLTGG